MQPQLIAVTDFPECNGIVKTAVDRGAGRRPGSSIEPRSVPDTDTGSSIASLSTGHRIANACDGSSLA
eukprot:246919-Rhodomonas_salina.1